MTALLLLILTQAPDAGSHAGDLSKQEIFQVIKCENPQILECYAHIPKDLRDTKVVASWTIDRDGSVERVTIDQTADVPLGDCIKNVITHWRFPRPRRNGPVNVTFPWLPKVAFDE